MNNDIDKINENKNAEHGEILKEYKLSTFSIKNKTSVYVLTLIIVLMGLVGYRAMPKESYPEIKQPNILVSTVYPGNSPVDMENLVTRPIEKELKSLKGVKKFTSTSIQDFSTVIIEFELNVKVEKALQEVKDAVDKAKADLPRDLPTDPNVTDINFSDFPILNINLAGNFDYNVLKENAEYLQDEIEKLPEVSEVDIRGLLDKEVRISVDKARMEALQISFYDIETAIQSENITMSGGEVLSVEGAAGEADEMADVKANRRTIRIAGEFTDYKQILDIIVKNEFQRTVYLRDIATVEFGPEEVYSFARMNGNPVVSLDVKKKSGENLLNCVDKINVVLEEAKKNKLPQGLDIRKTNDQSIQTRDSVNNLENSIIAGIILVVLVLLFFMGVRNSMFVGIAIPLSMLMGYAILYFMGTTLNFMVLFALIMALGMLVDDGVVVVENIYRLYTTGKYTKFEASKYGIGEVAWPVISSTLTKVAAFVPLLFWEDLLGEFMKYLPITISIVLMCSLFVALVINPVLTAYFMKLETLEHSTKTRRFWINNSILIILGIAFTMGGFNTFGSLLLVSAIIGILTRYFFKPASFRFQNGALVRLENFYNKLALWTLKGKRPLLVMAITVFMLIFSIVFFANSGTKVVFFPDNEPEYVNVFIEMPVGTDIQQTNEFTKKVEKKVKEAIGANSNAVDAVLAQVGEGTSDPMEGPSVGASPNRARITISFVPTEKRVHITDVKTSKIFADVREALNGYSEANITVEKNSSGPPVGKPIQVEVSGDNYDSLIKYAYNIKAFMEAEDIPGVDKLKTDLETGKPELVVNVNREAARRFGISTIGIAAAIRTGSFGKEISKFKEGEDDYPINLRLNQTERYDEASLMNQKITFRDMNTGRIVQVPISAVANVEYSNTFGSVKRKDMDRVIMIYSNVKQGYNANEIVGKFKTLLADYKLPAGYEFKFTGEQEEQSKSTSFLGNAFMIAFLIIFLILVAQFNSVLNPLIIMASVIFSTIGVFLGFAIFKQPFSILMCGIGIISLAGIAVNNAIVLIDFINLERDRRKKELGIPDDGDLSISDLIVVIAHGGRTRLRPVLLTAITNILGLVPLAIGLNINFFTLLSRYDAQIYVGGDSAIFWGPLSWTIIYGLTFTTFLTLLVVPAMYLLSEKTMRLFQKLSK